MPSTHASDPKSIQSVVEEPEHTEGQLYFHMIQLRDPIL